MPTASLLSTASPFPFALPWCASLQECFLALGCTILSGYYNVSGHVRWANTIILCRVFLASAVSLYAALALDLSPWWFLVLSELITLLLWYAATTIYHRHHPERTRYLLMDRSLEEAGQVVNFSVSGDTEQICQASQKIADFCRENQMNPRQVMRISLAIEEVMTMIVQENPALPSASTCGSFPCRKLWAFASAMTERLTTPLTSVSPMTSSTLVSS